MLRNAERKDLPVLIGLLADDALGSTREAQLDPLPPAYMAAFEEIERDPSNELVVVEEAGTIAGMPQLTYIPGLAHQGGERAQIECVRVAASTPSPVILSRSEGSPGLDDTGRSSGTDTIYRSARSYF